VNRLGANEPTNRATCVRVVAHTCYPPQTPSPRVRLVEMGAHLGRSRVQLDYCPTITDADYSRVAAGRLSPATMLVLLRDSWRAAQADAAEDELALVHRLRSLTPSPADRRPIDVYDFDDALYFKATSDGRSKFATLKREAVRTIGYMRRARLVLAGNSVLAGAARAYASRVEVIPSCVDPDLQPLRHHGSGDSVKLGWIGSPTTSSYLLPVLDVIAGLCERGAPLSLIVMGAGELPVRAPWLTEQRWSLDAERSLLTEIDVGLMPLSDDPWTRGKCGYKLLRYYSAGVPAIGSPVGASRELLEAGGGLAATTMAQWRQAIEELSGEAVARRELGLRGREFVRREYSYQVWAPRLAALLKELA
jgi:glycosyltransferase involved in cell wall biosynthesis